VRCELYASGRARGGLGTAVTKYQITRKTDNIWIFRPTTSKWFVTEVSVLSHEIFTYVCTELSLHQLPSTGTIKSYPSLGTKL